MRHRNGPRKLNRTTSHRLAMLRNMCNSMIMHEAIDHPAESQRAAPGR